VGAKQRDAHEVDSQDGEVDGADLHCAAGGRWRDANRLLQTVSSARNLVVETQVNAGASKAPKVHKVNDAEQDRHK
jgi:hypothetical protein